MSDEWKDEKHEDFVSMVESALDDHTDPYGTRRDLNDLLGIIAEAHEDGRLTDAENEHCASLVTDQQNDDAFNAEAASIGRELADESPADDFEQDNG